MRTVPAVTEHCCMQIPFHAPCTTDTVLISTNHYHGVGQWYSLNCSISTKGCCYAIHLLLRKCTVSKGLLQMLIDTKFGTATKSVQDLFILLYNCRKIHSIKLRCVKCVHACVRTYIAMYIDIVS